MKIQNFVQAIEPKYDAVEAFKTSNGDSFRADAEAYQYMDSESAARDRIARNAEVFKEYAIRRNRDSLSSNQALHLARELEYIYSEVLRDVYAPNSAIDLFATDTSVPAGARTHTVRRVRHSGEARYYSHAGDNRGQTGFEREEDTFPVLPIVTSLKLDYFDELSNRYSGMGSIRSELELAARQVVEDFMNEKIWYGDVANKMMGVLNYRWLPRANSVITWGDGTTADAIFAEMVRLANTPNVLTKTRFSPTRILTSNRLKNYLMGRHISIGQRDDSILDAFVGKQSFITSTAQIIGVPELQGVDGNPNLDAMIFDRPDRKTIANVVPQGLTSLPMQITDGFSMDMPMYMLHGGVVMRDVLNTMRVDCTIGDGLAG